MFVILIHQIFWGFFSFFLFYFIMRNFVFVKIEKSSNLRKTTLANLAKAIKEANDKNDIIKTKIDFMIKIDIPEKQNAYVFKNMEEYIEKNEENFKLLKEDIENIIKQKEVNVFFNNVEIEKSAKSLLEKLDAL